MQTHNEKLATEDASSSYALRRWLSLLPAVAGPEPKQWEGDPAGDDG